MWHSLTPQNLYAGFAVPGYKTARCRSRRDAPSGPVDLIHMLICTCICAVLRQGDIDCATCERAGEHVDGFHVAESGQRVTAPAVQEPVGKGIR